MSILYRLNRLLDNRHQSLGGGGDEPTSSNDSDDPEPPSSSGTLAVALNPLRFVITRLWLLEQKRGKDPIVNEPDSSEGKLRARITEDGRNMPPMVIV